MTLKTSFATVLKAIRIKRNISQRDFGDASRTYLSKLEGAKSSITLDKLDLVSQRLGLSPLTLLALTLSAETESPVVDLITQLRAEVEGLERNGGLPGLEKAMQGTSTRVPRKPQIPHASSGQQAEFSFAVS
ncbi:helix-turn-helix domain-containing protein [Pseudomonas putida]|uniref:helix-turn-helix domain-containing protein n=1 Tax=Pseudomonas putida TaxID=303 RepID=UPI0039E0C5A2